MSRDLWMIEQFRQQAQHAVGGLGGLGNMFAPTAEPEMIDVTPEDES